MARPIHLEPNIGLEVNAVEDEREGGDAGRVMLMLLFGPRASGITARPVGCAGNRIKRTRSIVFSIAELVLYI